MIVATVVMAAVVVAAVRVTVVPLPVPPVATSSSISVLRALVTVVMPAVVVVVSVASGGSRCVRGLRYEKGSY